MSKLRKSARGRECQVRIPRGCNRNPETVVLAHANGSAAGKGIGAKSFDALGAFSCSSCHDIVDRRAPVPEGFTHDDVKLMFLEGHLRTLRIWIDEGLVKF